MMMTSECLSYTLKDGLLAESDGLTKLTMADGASFLFVNYSGGPSTTDVALRKQIRWQAMSRAAAARRKRGNYGKANLGQLPEQMLLSLYGNPQDGETQVEPSRAKEHVESLVTYQSCRTFEPPNAETSQEWTFGVPQALNPMHNVQGSPHIPWSMPSTGYELTRIKYNFDVLDLSSLACYHMGAATGQALLSQRSSLSGVLQCRHWSYCSFLPMLYGKSTHLDDAIHCVALRVRQFVGALDPGTDRLVLVHYKKALQSLQLALNDPEVRFQPEVLCATEILAIYEVSGPVSHVRQEDDNANYCGTNSCSRPHIHPLVNNISPVLPR